MGEKVTLQKIADELNISKVTVHKALNDKSGVSAELKAKIFEMAQRTGYNSKPLNSKNTTFLYIFSKKFFFASEPFYSVIYYHLENLCAQARYSLKLLVMDESDYQNNIGSVVEEYHPGGIFIGGEIERDNIRILESLNLPLVFIDFFSTKYKANYIFSDSYHGSYYLTKYLKEMGHQKIGFVGDPYYADSLMDRLLGMKKAFMRFHIEDNPAYHILKRIDDITDMSLIQLPEQMPTVFICASDLCAYKLYLKLQMSGYKIPDDVSVVSFDNTEISAKLNPSLTSCGSPKEDYASSAFRIMMSQIERGTDDTVYQFLNPAITIRESVKNLTVKK